MAMVKHGPKWSQMVPNGPKLSTMIPHSPKLSKQSKNVEIGKKWSQIVQYGLNPGGADLPPPLEFFRCNIFLFNFSFTLFLIQTMENFEKMGFQPYLKKFKW